MWIAVIVFVSLGLWCYPLTLLLLYDGSWRLFWLPRVWCGYAVARELHRQKPARKRRPPGFYLRLGLLLLRRLQQAAGRFYLTPGSSRAFCIVGVTLGNLILSSAGAAVCGRRRKRSRKWPLNMISKS